jgi:hypothetical protein
MGREKMTKNFNDGVPFDPGFVQHISAIIPNIQYVYSDLEKYRNFGQKKMQFKMVFPNMEKLINNYIGFYAGCILWAKAIKTLGDKPITNNFCCGGEYNEEETLQELRFLKEFLEVLPRDVKYYIGSNYTINPHDIKILDYYEEFLKINQGFINAEKTSDLNVPENIPINCDTNKIFEKVEEVVETGKLYELKELLS